MTLKDTGFVSEAAMTKFFAGIGLDLKEGIDMFFKASEPGELLKLENGTYTLKDDCMRFTSGDLRLKEKIKMCKAELEYSDHKIIMYIEGVLSNEEFEKVVKRRKELRKEINTCETVMKACLPKLANNTRIDLCMF